MQVSVINYQVIVPPAPGEHVAFGDTGSSIYTNSVLGARTNFEGGPSALAAALTGRTPRYGFHLDACRRGTARYVLDVRPQDWSDWGAVGGIVGRDMASYWSVPVIDGVFLQPDPLAHAAPAAQPHARRLDHVAEQVALLERRDVHGRACGAHCAPPVARGRRPRRLRRETSFPTGQRIPSTARTSSAPPGCGASTAARPVPGL